MAVHSLKPATDRRLGEPLPHQLANQTRVHPVPKKLFTQYHAVSCAYAVLAVISNCYPPVQGRLPTRYSPVRHSVYLSSTRRLPLSSFVRLACVRHAASVHPEPGSNSHVHIFYLTRLCRVLVKKRFFNRRLIELPLIFSSKLSLANLSLVYCVWVVDFSTTKNVGHLSSD